MTNKFLIVPVILCMCCLLYSCEENIETSAIESQQPLPIYGNKEFIAGVDTDTIYHTIPYWSFVNQDSVFVNSTQYANKPYIAYFFFSNCPQICPKINGNMKQFQDDTKELDYNVIAYTVDPERDSVKRLKFYAEEYGFNLSNYNFVTGNQNDIYELGVNGYLVPNSEDALAPGGFLHSDKLILIDSKGRIRGFYDGLESAAVEQLKKDLEKLIQDESSIK